MSHHIELETTRYWHAKALNEIKQRRRQKGREAAHSITTFGVFLALAFIGFYAFSQGWLDQLDVVGALQFSKEVIQTMAINATEFVKNFN